MTTPLCVVGIGASAGGVSALSAVLSALPADFPAAVLVVQHLGPRAPSHLPQLLARDSCLPVRSAHHGALIEPATVYIAPPGVHLTVHDGRIVLSETAPVHFSRPSVDVLFQSIAESCGPNAVGVILTGAGVDGADGLRAIKGAGGRTVVEDPETAQCGGMPSAARATGCADVALPLARIGATVVDLVRHAAIPGATRERER